MPARTWFILIMSVIAAAGATIALVLAMELNVMWVGLTATLMALVVRKSTW